MTTRISRHLDTATLMSFAAGGISEALAAAVSAHVSMCAACRGEVRDMEAHRSCAARCVTGTPCR